jgi:hypothetical protein
VPNKRFPPNARHSKKICQNPECGDLFAPCRINGSKQRYCTKPECQYISKKNSQAKWVAKNPTYWADRWKLNQRLGLATDSAEKMVSTDEPSPISNKPNEIVHREDGSERDLVSENQALQDSIKLIEAQHIAVMGALCMILGEGIQEVIDGGGSLFRKCYGIGRRAGVASLSETLNRLETCDGIESHLSGTDPAIAESFQLGGSALCARGSP